MGQLISAGDSFHPASDPLDAELLDTAVTLLRRGARVLGRDLEGVRVPIERGDGEIYYSWINGQRMGNVFVVPHFESAAPETEERAHRALAEAMPGVTLAPLPSQAMIQMDGAIHCITAQLNGRSAARVARAREAAATSAPWRGDP